ncbi:MAG: hypothetical protein JST19_09870 [Bacteroidetes bacterium]|nr:hypothetical protein [Bacteroidota bacterium]
MSAAINVSEEERKLISAAKQRPSVSIVMSFEPVIASKEEMAHRLKTTLERVKRELLSTYPESKAMSVILKLQNLIKNINYNTGKRAIALFVSPQTENIFYLDTPVDDHLVIDNGFSIRDLVYSRKKHIEYLILLLSTSSSKMFLGNSFKIIPVRFNVPDKAIAYRNDVAERVGNFSDPDQRKEELLDKFLRHIDQGLTIALKSYPFPVFVAGTDRVLGHFRQISKNGKRLAQFIHGNYIDATDAEIAELMQPYVVDWINIKQRELLTRLQNVDDEGKLIYGIRDVWASVNDGNTRLLVVEKNYRQQLNNQVQKSFYVRDAVDKIIEKVLQSGGDVEFVDDDLLKAYKHIALIPFY